MKYYFHIKYSVPTHMDTTILSSQSTTTVETGVPTNSASPLVPRVGIGVLVIKDSSKVLVGRRRSSVGDATFALPGGHLEFGESWEECAAREVLEETGLAIHNVKFAGVYNTVMLKEKRPSHFVTIFMRGELQDVEQEPQNLEPDKCDGWEWVQWPQIPQPVFEPLRLLIASGYQL